MMFRVSQFLPWGRGGLVVEFFCAVVILGMVGCEEKSSHDTNGAGAGETAGESAVQYEKVDDDHNGEVEAVKFVADLVPAAKPTGLLDEDAGCVTPACHASFATARHVHGPVSVDGCTACHEEDKGDHSFPRRRAGNETCTFCHPVVGTKTNQHDPVVEPGCMGCHNQHASDTKYLLKARSVEKLCSECHAIEMKHYAHGPFVAGECGLCHEPHQSDTKNLLRGGEGNRHCYSCHIDSAIVMADSRVIHEPAKESCVKCHDAHTESYPYQLSDEVSQSCFECHESMQKHIDQSAGEHGAVFTGDGCANCHDPHGASQDKLLHDSEDKLCLSCHDKRITANDGRVIESMEKDLSRKYLHGPLRYGSCSGCHNPHGEDNVKLLKGSFPGLFYASFEVDKYGLCFSCHNKQIVLQEETEILTDFRDGQVNLHYLHVNRQPKGRTCKACHAIHGSDLPRHMAYSVPFEDSGWKMPIRFEKAADGGQCMPGCHDMKEYRRSRIVEQEINTPLDEVSHE